MNLYINKNTNEVITDDALLFFINRGRKKQYKTIKNAIKFCGYGNEFIACELITFEKMVKYFNNGGLQK